MTKLILLSLLVFSSAQASDFNVKGNGEFLATGKPGFIKIHALGGGLTGKVQLVKDAASGNFNFPLGVLDSGVSLRDKHMKDEFLETSKFPEAKLTFKDLKLSGHPESKGYSQKALPFKGQFTVHGVTQPVNGTIDLDGGGELFKGQAEFKIKMSQYKFREPKWLGMSVDDEVQVKAQIDVSK